ncbi:MAG: hypothetical protein H6Q86_5745, partial [candidate division NC10 bacterium]|nr:hypothetical protein [candidate division NC10 bacterium]
MTKVAPGTVSRVPAARRITPRPDAMSMLPQRMPPIQR